LKQINIGLIGYKFMGKAHSHAYKDVGMFFDLPAQPVMKALCGRDEAGVKEAADRFGWESYETSWEALFQRDDIDLIDITAPSNVHREIVEAAAQAGKHVFCEKPLALNLEDSVAMWRAVEKAGVKHMVGFNYRRVPAVMLAKRLIEEGAIGEIRHFRGTYLQDFIVDPNFPLVWRLQREVAGSGPLGDLASHLIDIAHFLVGDIAEVVGMEKTFIKKRPVPSSMTGLSATSAGGALADVTVEDASNFLFQFDNGALGSLEASRMCPGRKNYQTFEINGSEGSVYFSFERMNELQFFSRSDASHAQGFRTIQVTEPEHAYLEAWWPPGHIIGYEHTFIHEVKDLIEAIVADEMPQPSFEDGVKCQAVVDSVIESAKTRRWVEVPKVSL
jgi:predicted dehydrogenase